MSRARAKQGWTPGGVVVVVFAVLLGFAFVDSGGPGRPKPVAEVSAAADIPASYLKLYRAAASECAKLDTATLAAQGYVESNHGRSPLPGVHSGHNGVQARGPMQIKPVAWSEVGVGPYLPNVYRPAKAIPAAARYVCRYDVDQYGGGGDYVSEVDAKAAEYRAAGV